MLRTYTLLPALAILLPIALSAQVPNDDPCSATTIVCGQLIDGTTVDALPDNAATCGTTLTAPGVWYVFAGTDQQVTITTCLASDFDTKLNVYSGPCDGLACVVGNDDACDLASAVSFVAVSGTDYFILVQGYDGFVGTFTIDVMCTAPTADVCQGALPIACGETVTNTTVGANPDTAPDCFTDIDAPGIWYTFTGVDGEMTLTTCPNSSYDTKLNVYSGECSALVCVAGNDDTAQGVFCSTVAFASTAGTTYYVLVQGYDGETGDVELSLACATCAAPQNVNVLPTDVTAYIFWNSINSSAQYTIEYGPFGFTPGAGTILTGQTGVDGPPALISGLMANSNYALYIQEDCGGDPGFPVGPVAFTTQILAPAPNAQCSGALPIACDAPATGNTADGIYLPMPTCGPANVSTKGLWYGFTGTGEDVTLSTCSGATNFDTKISVFTGLCDQLICVAGSDDAPNCPANRSAVVFPTTVGTAYLVLVHGYDQDQGDFELAMTCSPACAAGANDHCNGATLLAPQPTGGCEASTGTTVCAFAPAFPNPPCDPWGNIVDVWYGFNTGWTASLTLILEAVSAGQINAALYNACDQLTYIACWTEVAAPIDLVGLPANTDLLLRIWNGGSTDAGTFTVCVEGDFNVGAEELPVVEQPLLWPVPASDVLTVQAPVGTRTLTVADLHGRTVLMQPTNGAQRTLLPVEGLSPGAYLVRGDGGLVGRFVKE